MTDSLAKLCRDAGNDCFKRADYSPSQSDAKLLSRCAMLFAVISIMLEVDPLPEGTLYQRRGRAFVKVAK